jgi:AcrR family transcriptional regulator
MARQAGGRTREATTNDALIFRAAREVLVADPNAPIAEVAARAGVGMAALYRRYPSKEFLLASLCAEGQRVYIAEAETALAQPGDGFEVFSDFLRRIVASDTHSLSGRLAGTFKPTEVHLKQALRLREVAEALFDRARSSGHLRTDLTLIDVGLLLEAIAFPQFGTKARTAELRQRLLALMIDGLRAGHSPLPGSAPTWEEQERRWTPRT